MNAIEPIYAWILVTIIMAVIEALTANLVTVWFAVGAFAAVVTAFFGGSILIQILVFALVSALALVITKPIVKRIASKTPEKTNADMAVGKICPVTEEIDNISQKGEVICLGRPWSARSQSGEIIKEGEKVKVLSIDGVKLIVEKADE